MKGIRWNLANTFGLIGCAIAYWQLYPIFGLYPLSLLNAAVGFIGVYLTSVYCGRCFLQSRHKDNILTAILAGAGIAASALLLGTLLIGATNYSIFTIEDIVAAHPGQSFWNTLYEVLPRERRVLIGPLVGGMAFGIRWAAILGSMLGIVSHILRHRYAKIYPLNPGRLARAVCTLLIAVGLAASLISIHPIRVMQMLTTRSNESPLAIRACGETRVSDGVIAHCSGSPCDATGKCDWERETLAFILYLTPPAGSGWVWGGGGLGATHRGGPIVHSIRWIKRASDGAYRGSSPMHFERFKLAFVDDEFIEIAKQRFIYEPGMLLVVKFQDDWSIGVTQGPEALRGLAHENLSDILTIKERYRPKQRPIAKLKDE